MFSSRADAFEILSRLRTHINNIERARRGPPTEPGGAVMPVNEFGASRPSGFRTGTLSVRHKLAAPAGLGMWKPGVLATWSASASDRGCVKTRAGGDANTIIATHGRVRGDAIHRRRMPDASGTFPGAAR